MEESGIPAWDELWRKVAQQFPLGSRSHHGPEHWKRVLENGLLLASHSGAKKIVVRLFALFHDSRRQNEAIDPGHGDRGAELARRYRSEGVFQLDDEQMRLLLEACRGHTSGTTTEDPTIGTCWDADRLDLARVGFTPDPQLLSTRTAKDPAFIREAVARSLPDQAK